MCILIVNPIPDKNLPHLLDSYPIIPEEFIVSTMKEKSILRTLIGGSFKAHLMHPDLIVEGYDVLYNRVGCESSVGSGTIIATTIHDYLDQLRNLPEEVVDESDSPSIEWSCKMLGISYKGRPQWDIEYSNPTVIGYTKALLPYNYSKLWNIVGDDVISYILISLIINDKDVWTRDMKDRRYYLKNSPFETKLYMFLSHDAPISFMDKFKYWCNAVKDIVPIDYNIDSSVILNYMNKLATNHVTEDMSVDEYDSLALKYPMLYCYEPYNYI